MREIEVKAQLKDKKAVSRKLAELGCVFGQPKTQNDIIFQKKDVGDSPAARIRETGDDTILFTVKKRGTNELASQEHEVTVNSATELEKMLLLLDQEEMVRINKTRISSQYNDYQICVDDVENLGSFIEVEVLIPDADADKSDQVQEELFTFLTSLGISPDDRATVGYNTLLLAKKNEKQS